MINIIFHYDFESEFLSFDASVRKSIYAYADLLKTYGASLSRPYVGSLKSRKYKNLKELRITTTTGEWRVSFAFDPQRNAILLYGASKSGITQMLFYNKLIKISEKRYENHLKELDNA